MSGVCPISYFYIRMYSRNLKTYIAYQKTHISYLDQDIHLHTKDGYILLQFSHMPIRISSYMMDFSHWIHPQFPSFHYMIYITFTTFKSYILALRKIHKNYNRIIFAPSTSYNPLLPFGNKPWRIIMLKVWRRLKHLLLDMQRNGFSKIFDIYTPIRQATSYIILFTQGCIIRA